MLCARQGQADVKLRGYPGMPPSQCALHPTLGSKMTKPACCLEVTLRHRGDHGLNPRKL